MGSDDMDALRAIRTAGTIQGQYRTAYKDEYQFLLHKCSALGETLMCDGQFERDEHRHKKTKESLHPRS